MLASLFPFSIYPLLWHPGIEPSTGASPSSGIHSLAAVLPFLLVSPAPGFSSPARKSAQILENYDLIWKNIEKLSNENFVIKLIPNSYKIKFSMFARFFSYWKKRTNATELIIKSRTVAKSLLSLKFKSIIK